MLRVILAVVLLSGCQTKPSSIDECNDAMMEIQFQAMKLINQCKLLPEVQAAQQVAPQKESI